MVLNVDDLSGLFDLSVDRDLPALYSVNVHTVVNAAFSQEQHSIMYLQYTRAMVVDYSGLLQVFQVQVSVAGSDG